ncbi:MAG: Clp protease ClpP [Bacteroidales bacterium]|nr:Clp protease ClpP [Bacteroidales bacterium]
MAVLKIHSDIIDDESKQLQLIFMGLDSGISFQTVDDFISSMVDDDNEIDIRLHCRGGSVSEGWVIYDKLRQSGKSIRATIEGKCASMASILLLAAPSENRAAYPNAQLLIHMPYIPEYTLADAYTSEDLQKIAADLKTEEDRMLDVYVERTGGDREELRALMLEDKYINMEEAKRLGFITEINPPVSASARVNNNKSKIKKMAKKKETVLEWLARKAGYSKVAAAEEAFKNDNGAVAMELQTADGTTLTIDREEGDPVQSYHIMGVFKLSFFLLQK